MNTRRAVALRTCSLAGGGWLAFGAVTPALAAKLDLPLSQPDYLLGGLLVLLVAALVMRIVKRHEDETPAPMGPDMRWWKNPLPS